MGVPGPTFPMIINFAWDIAYCGMPGQFAWGYLDVHGMP